MLGQIQFLDQSSYECRFTTCLDSSKTGLRVKKAVFEKDRKDWGTEKPWYLSALETNKPGKNQYEAKCIKRGSQGRPFILDILVEHGRYLKDKLLEDYENLWSSRTEDECDEDLNRFWKDATARANQAKLSGFPGFASNLEDIERHVRQSYDAFRRATSTTTFKRESLPGSDSKGDPYNVVAREFAQEPTFRTFQFFSHDDVRLLKASLAATKSVKFAFCVAHKDLCAIKARTGGNVAFTNQFAQVMSISRTVARSLARVTGSVDS